MATNAEHYSCDSVARHVAAAFVEGCAGNGLPALIREVFPDCAHMGIAAHDGQKDWIVELTDLMQTGPLTMSLLPKGKSAAGMAMLGQQQSLGAMEVTRQRMYDLSRVWVKSEGTTLLAAACLRQTSPPGSTEAQIAVQVVVESSVLPSTSGRYVAELQRLAQLLAPLVGDAADAMVRDVQCFCFSSPYAMPEERADAQQASTASDSNGHDSRPRQATGGDEGNGGGPGLGLPLCEEDSSVPVGTPSMGRQGSRRRLKAPMSSLDAMGSKLANLFRQRIRSDVTDQHLTWSSSGELDAPTADRPAAKRARATRRGSTGSDRCSGGIVL